MRGKFVEEFLWLGRFAMRHCYLMSSTTRGLRLISEDCDFFGFFVVLFLRKTVQNVSLVFGLSNRICLNIDSFVLVPHKAHKHGVLYHGLRK